MKRWILTVALAAISLEPASAEPYAEGRPPVIEAHAHLSAGAEAVIARIMEDSGIRLMVNLSGGNPRRGMGAAIQLAKAMPGRIVNFYTPDWARFGEPDFGVVEAQRLDDAVGRFGYRGLKIAKHLGLGLRHPSGMLVDIDDPIFDPLWEAAGALGVPVAIHTGDPKAFFEPATPDNERWEELSVHPGWSFYGPQWPSRAELLAARDRVIARHPRTTFICVHFGNNPEDLSAVRALLEAYPNALVDIAARVGEIGRHDPNAVRALLVEFQDRVLFGTDIGVGPGGFMLGSNGAEPPRFEDVAPFYAAHFEFLETDERGIAHPAPIQGRWTVDAIDLPRDVLDKIYFRNAERWILGATR
jgi:predicted TIM-barrel fold metal-dependent hydrolase